jgi:tyrosine-protein kinase Etk/Wzc
VVRICGTIHGRKPQTANIIKLSYKDTDPELARDAANNMVQAYLEQTIAFKAEEASRTVEFIEQQLDNVKKDLDIAERNLETFKRSTGVVQLDAEAQELIKKYSETEKERAGIVLQKKQAEFALSSLKDAMTRKETYSPAVLRDDLLSPAWRQNCRPEVKTGASGRIHTSTSPGESSSGTDQRACRRSMQLTKPASKISRNKKGSSQPP